MRSQVHEWTSKDDTAILQMVSLGMTDNAISKALGLTYEQIRKRRRVLQGKNLINIPIRESSQEEYSNPLVMEGNATIFPDVELPFHNADFLNRVIDLSLSWGIENAVFAGDLVHLSSLSNWGPHWYRRSSKVADEIFDNLREFAGGLHAEDSSKLLELLGELEQKGGDPDLSEEMHETRNAVRIISQTFKSIDLVLGNHEQRYMRKLDTPIAPEEILRLIGAHSNWRSAPYFFSKVISGGVEYQIEHPYSTSKNSASKLASIYKVNILQAHSHRWSIEYDPSGTWYAIHMGHICDESRLPYASQRHGITDKHSYGAVILKDGYPYLLGEHSPFTAFRRIWMIS